MNKKELIVRYLLFSLGLFLCAFGVSFVTKASLGTSPISSVPYTLSLCFEGSFGLYTLFISIILFVLQMIIMKKDFPKLYFLQIPFSFLFSYFIDLSMSLLSFMNVEAYALKLAILVGGSVLIGVGVYLEVIANVVMLPGESFVKAVSHVYKKDFGKTKVVFDVSMSVIAAIIGFVVFQKLVGVREGTIIGALLVGNVVRGIRHIFSDLEDRLLGKTKDEEVSSIEAEIELL